MRIDGDTIKFRNGREEYANLGIIGIHPDGNLSGGYDEGFCCDDDMPLTKSERQELAAYMIEQWAKFGAKEKV